MVKSSSELHIIKIISLTP